MSLAKIQLLYIKNHFLLCTCIQKAGLEGLWHGVVPAPTPRMAAADAFDGEPAAFEYAMLFDSFNGILRASGHVPATGRKQRRNAVTIKIHGQQHNKHENFLHGIQHFETLQLQTLLCTRKFSLFYNFLQRLLHFPVDGCKVQLIIRHIIKS